MLCNTVSLHVCNQIHQCTDLSDSELYSLLFNLQQLTLPRTVSNDCFFFLLAAFLDFILFFNISAARHTIIVSNTIQATYLMFSSVTLLHVVCHDNFGGPRTIIYIATSGY